MYFWVQVDKLGVVREASHEIKVNHTNVFWSKVFLPNDFVDPIDLSKRLTQARYALT